MASYNNLPIEIRLMIMECSNLTFIPLMFADLTLKIYVLSHRDYYIKKYKECQVDGTIINFNYIFYKEIKHGYYEINKPKYETMCARGFMNHRMVYYDKIKIKYHVGRKIKSSYYQGNFIKYKVSSDEKHETHYSASGKIKQSFGRNYNTVNIYNLEKELILTAKINNLHPMCTMLYQANKRYKNRIFLDTDFVEKLSRIKNTVVYELVDHSNKTKETLLCRKGMKKIKFYLTTQDINGNRKEYKNATVVRTRNNTLKSVVIIKNKYMPSVSLSEPDIHLYDPSDFKINNCIHPTCL